MRVALDTSPLESGHGVRGIGFYTRSLARELKKILSGGEWSFEEVNLKNKNNQPCKYDLVHYPYFDLFFVSLPYWKRAKMVVTVHDVIPLLYPEYFPPGTKGKLKFQVQKLLLRRVDAVITDTEASKSDVVKYLAYPQERVFPVHLGRDRQFARIEDKVALDRLKKKYSLPEKFVLYVGDVNYNKNLVRLAEACKLAGATLVIVGKQATMEEFDRQHPEMKAWAEFLERFGGDAGVRRLGFVASEELVGLYSCAGVYCQASLSEGFGLPVLEAMSCGCPVVCASTPALVEIARDAALFADPNSSAQIAARIRQVLEDARISERLREKGYKNVQRFSWERCARETVEVYRKVLGLSQSV